jgi:hypothetical protein
LAGHGVQLLLEVAPVAISTVPRGHTVAFCVPVLSQKLPLGHMACATTLEEQTMIEMKKNPIICFRMTDIVPRLKTLFVFCGCKKGTQDAKLNRSGDIDGRKPTANRKNETTLQPETDGGGREAETNRLRGTRNHME